MERWRTWSPFWQGVWKSTHVTIPLIAGWFLGVASSALWHRGDPHPDVIPKSECMSLCGGITSGDYNTIKRAEAELADCNVSLETVRNNFSEVLRVSLERPHRCLPSSYWPIGPAKLGRHRTTWDKDQDADQ